MVQDRLRRLMVFGVCLQIKIRGEVAELVRRHVNPDVFRDHFRDLVRERFLALAGPLFRHEQKFVWIGAGARQEMTPIPPESPRDIRRNFNRQVPTPGLGLLGGNVQQQWALRAVRLERSGGANARR